MSLSKQRISSPLEAGRSILDANLPPQLTGTLEYVSKRIARKNLHITLIVVKNDWATSAGAEGDKQLSCFKQLDFVIGFRDSVQQINVSHFPSAPNRTDRQSTALDSPPTPGSPLPSTPMTPHTPSSIATITTAASSNATSHPFQTPEPFGIRLVYTSPVSPKDERTIRATIAKAERKFHIGMGGLPAVTTASGCGLSADLVRRSIQQNEVLFSSEGLTLLGLDRLYSFKAALSAYAKSIITPNSRIQTPVRSPGLSNHPINTMPPTPTSTAADSSRLEDAVDCLRRLVLSNGGRSVPKADLYRSFDWMGVNPIALSDVERMYRRAYGGLERRGPFEMPPILRDKEREHDGETDAKRMGFIKIGTPPPPKSQTTPILKLNTNITTTPRLIRPKPKVMPQVPALDTGADLGGKPSGTQEVNHGANSEGRGNVEELEIRIDSLEIVPEKGNSCDAEEDGDRTPHPLRDGPLRPSMFWANGNTLSGSIDELLSPCDNRQSQRLGPMTPNGYDDISPVTRGEWGFLFKGDTWTQGTRAAVAFVQ
ncbi:hypothetical protein CIB48_g5247 [Xylaria polymorpha]|nr:hypothetical protein CIB48_g5247 [Xylaria polymorpha]